MVNLRAVAQGLLRLCDVMDFAAALRTDPALRDDLTMEIWNEFGEPAMPRLRPLPSSVVSLDAAAHEGGAPLIEMLEAKPVNEAARRARVLEEQGVLYENLDEARNQARLGRQEARLWDLFRYERCSMGEAACRTGWSRNQVHVVRDRMLKKVRTAEGLLHTPI